MKLSKTIKIVGNLDEGNLILIFKDYYGIKLTKTQLRRLAEKDMSIGCAFWQDIIDSDRACKGKGKVEIDTCTLENIADAICQKLMGYGWPVAGKMKKLSKKKQREFWTEFSTKLVEAKYRLTPNWLQEHLEDL
jgi:hypothetical protein